MNSVHLGTVGRGARIRSLLTQESLIRAAAVFGLHPDCDALGGAAGDTGNPANPIARAVSCYRQTWSATSYLRLILHGLFGMVCQPEGLAFSPLLPEGMDRAELLGLPWRQAHLDLELRRGATAATLLNGKPLMNGLLPGDLTGRHKVGITLCEK